MVREDLVSSAIAFLQDPSVAVSPIEKRKAFLQSKNLTEEEVGIALARAGDASPHAAPPAQYGAPGYAYNGAQTIRHPPQAPYSYGYGSYQDGSWSSQPPVMPRRDWRDWFIMATVTGGVGYGLYTVAKRYVMPLISPPTPPQLEQDKASIDASFSRAFALIDQLATDTAALKSTEAERTERLDSALQEVESVISEMKAANKRREDDSRRIGDEVRGLKEMIPKALQGWKAEEDAKLKELGAGLKSLKILVGNRVGGDIPTTNSLGRSSQISERVGASGTSTPGDSKSQAPPSTAPSYSHSGISEKQDEASASANSSSTPAPASGVNAPKREVTSPFKFDSKPGGRAAIPAWQMAAANHSKATKIPAPETAKIDGSAEGSEASVDT